MAYDPFDPQHDSSNDAFPSLGGYPPNHTPDVNPLLTPRGQGFDSTGSYPSSGSTASSPYGQGFDTAGSVPDVNPLLTPRGQGFGAVGGSFDNTTPYAREQGIDSTSTTVPYDSGTTAPLPSVMTEADYQPDEAAMKKRRKKLIQPLIHLLVGAVCVGAIFYFIFQTTKGSASSGADTVGTYLTWGFVAIVGVSALLIIVRLIHFSKNPYNKRYYKDEARQAVRQSRYERSRQRYLNAHPSQQNTSSYGTTPSSSASRKSNKPISYDAARGMLVVGVLILTVGLVLSLITIFKKISNDHFMDHAISITAEIVECRSEKHVHKHKHGRRTTSYSYYAMVEYDYNGSHYRAGEFSVSKNDTIGDKIEVYIDPDNPADCRDKMSTSSFIFGLLGFIPLVVSGAVVAFNSMNLMKKAKRRQQEGR